MVMVIWVEEEVEVSVTKATWEDLETIWETAVEWETIWEVDLAEDLTGELN